MSYIKGLVVSGGPFFAPLLAFVKGLSPNRVVIVITVIANVTAATISTLSPYTTSGGFIAALIGINAAALMFLKGWHQFEAAMYSAEATQFEHRTFAERQAKASAPRAAGPNIKLPR